ncbi:MAG: hypothetical protein ACFFB2_14525 [Promethearchaeota archaeon]
MQKDPIQRDDVIKQLISQQFFIYPNIITDRTYRLQHIIQGSDQVLNKFSDFLHNLSYNLRGTDPIPYNLVLKKAGETLKLKSSVTQQRFYEKTHIFLGEGLATEDIMFITAIASILEVLDIQHFRSLIEKLYDLYLQLCIQNIPSINDKNLSKHFNAGIKLLGEIADSHFSLLHNILKCENLAQLFKIEIKYDQDIVKEYYQIVINKIISSGF